MRWVRTAATASLLALGACGQEPFAPASELAAAYASPEAPPADSSLRCTGCVAGPVQLTRVKSNTNRYAFRVNAVSGAEYAVVISAPDARAVKVKVLVNGVVTVRHYDLPESGPIRFTKQLSLTGTALVEAEMLGDFGATATFAIAKCSGAAVGSEKGEGVLGGTGRAGIQACGALADWRYLAIEGFSGTLVALDGRLVGDSGTLVVTGPHQFIATARPVPQAPAGAARAVSDVRALLSATDKVAAAEAVLATMHAATEGMTEVEAAEWRRDVFAASIDPESDLDPIVRASEALAGARIALPPVGVESGLRSEGPIADALAGTIILGHVNGVTTTINEAMSNLLALADVTRRANIGSYEPVLYYNHSNTLDPEAAVARCLDFVESVQPTALLSLSTATRNLQLRTNLAFCESNAGLFAGSGAVDFAQAIVQKFAIQANLPPVGSEVASLERNVATDVSVARGVILVAHSQGNLHVRQMLDRHQALGDAARLRISVISLAPPSRAASGPLARFNCWTIAEDLIIPVQSDDACPAGQDNYGAQTHFLATNFSVALSQEGGVGNRKALHGFVGSYLELARGAYPPYAARNHLTAVIRLHRAAIATQTPDPGLIFSDAFSADLGNWVARGGGNWTINSNNELVGDYDIGCGSSGCPQAQLLIADQFQPALLGIPNWRLVVRSGPQLAYCCYNGGAIVNLAKFSLWISDSQKDAMDVGGAWQGTVLPASMSTAFAAHQTYPWVQLAYETVSVPVWHPSEWQEVALEKRGNQYTVFFNGVQLYQVTRTFAQEPRVGFSTYGAVRLDDARLYRLP